MEQLWLNSPVGYPYAEKIEKNDEGNILRFCLMISGADEDTQEMVRGQTHDQRLTSLISSGFSFDPIWLGSRELPVRNDGVTRSALDDPTYRHQHGIGNGL